MDYETKKAVLFGLVIVIAMFVGMLMFTLGVVEAQSVQYDTTRLIVLNIVGIAVLVGVIVMYLGQHHYALPVQPLEFYSIKDMPQCVGRLGALDLTITPGGERGQGMSASSMAAAPLLDKIAADAVKGITFGERHAGGMSVNLGPLLEATFKQGDASHPSILSGQQKFLSDPNASTNPKPL